MQQTTSNLASSGSAIQVKKSILLILSIVTVSLCSSLIILIDIGVGPWDAIAITLASMINVKVGTMGMILNASCILIQLLILRKNFKLHYLLEFPMTLLIGVIVNTMLYYIFQDITISNYYLKVILLFLAYGISAFAVASVILLNMVTFPLESACIAISDKFNLKMYKIRQAVDVLSIVSVLVFFFIFKAQFSLREGTIIGMLFFGPMMGWAMKILEPIYKNLKMI